MNQKILLRNSSIENNLTHILEEFVEKSFARCTEGISEQKQRKT